MEAIRGLKIPDFIRATSSIIFIAECNLGINNHYFIPIADNSSQNLLSKTGF
jgi:hypothetical protein